MYHTWRRKLTFMATALICTTYKGDSQAYMIANTLSNISLESHPKDTIVDAHLIDHALFPHSSKRTTHQLETGLLVEGILRRSTYQLNMYSTQFFSAYDTRPTIKDRLERELLEVFGHTIRWREPTFLEGTHEGWSKVAALGPFDSKQSFGRLVKVCRWYENAMGPEELQRRSRLLTIMSVRVKGTPIWWHKEDMQIFVARKMDWETIIKVGDALRIWDSSHRRWSPVKVAQTRRLLLVLLYLRSASRHWLGPWDSSAEKAWLENFTPRQSAGHVSDLPSPSARSPSENSRLSVYTHRMKLLVGDMTSSFTRPWSAEELEDGSWITEGLRLEFVLKGFDLKLMINLRVALEAAKDPYSSRRTLTDGARLLLELSELDPDVPRISIRSWLDDVMGPGIFDDRLRLIMQRLQPKRFDQGIPLQRWKEQWGVFRRRVAAHERLPD